MNGGRCSSAPQAKGATTGFGPRPGGEMRLAKSPSMKLKRCRAVDTRTYAQPRLEHSARQAAPLPSATPRYPVLRSDLTADGECLELHTMLQSRGH